MNEERFPIPNSPDGTEDLLNWDLSELNALLSDGDDADLQALLSDYPEDIPGKEPPAKKTASDPEENTQKKSNSQKKDFRPVWKKPKLPDFQKLFSRPQKKSFLYGGIGILVLLVCLLVGILIGRAMDPYDCQILPNTTIGGIPVGGMTRMQAYKTLKAATKDTFTQEDMVITLPDGIVRLSPKDTGAKLKVWSAVNGAYTLGRKGSAEDIQAAVDASQTEGTNVDMLPFIKIDPEYIRAQLEAYATANNVPHRELSYHLSGQQPALEENLYDPQAPAQTLELTLGTPLEELDVDAVLSDVLKAYSHNTFSLSIDSIEHQTTPKAPDLDALYQEFYIAPVSTTLDMTTYQQVPGAYGYAPDLEAAKALLAKAQYGDTISIPMDYVKPEILGDEVYFRDELGYCETPHSNNANRAANLKLACAALDGLILQPGEEFSYNNTLGERTKERGYKPAPAYSGTRLVDSVGGGICQVSSTLYCATLYADLEIVFRVNHGFKSNYIGLGLDATVSWGKPDFQFRNNFNFPIQLKAETTDSHVKIWIMGTDEKDYYIKMTSGYSDDDDNIYCWTYKNKYDKETDQLISKEKEAYSRYSK